MKSIHEYMNEEPAGPKLIQGKIIHLSDEGYGFISTKEIPFTRIFFHWNGLRGDTLKFTDLKVNMKVEFSAHQHTERGWRAVNIKVIE